MATISSLTANVTANVSGFVNNLNRAEARSRQFGRNSSRHFNQSARAMQTMQRQAQMLQRAVVALMAAFTVERLVSFTKATLESANALNDQARSLGVTTSALQRYRFAAASVGIEQEKLDRSMERFVRRIGEARRGTGELATVATELNLSLDDPERTFLQLAEAAQQAGDAAEVTRIAYAAFGREGVAMGRLLMEGGDAIQALAGQAEVLGDTLTQQAADLNTQFTLVRQNLGVAFQRGLLTSVVGQFGDFNEALERNAQAAETWGRAAGNAFNAVANAARFLAENIQAVQGSVGALAGMRIGAMFGPWGAAIGALVGAMASLANESDRTREMLQQYDTVMGSVENATRGLLHITDDRLAQLNTEQRELVETAQAELTRTQALIAQIDAQTLAFRQSIERLSTFNILGIGDPTMARLNDVLDAVLQLTETQVDRAAALSQEIEDLLGIVTDTSNNGVPGFASSTSNAADETERFANEVNNLIRQLSPATARMQDLAAANDLLFQAFQAGIFGDPGSQEAFDRFMKLGEAAERSIMDIGDTAESEAIRIGNAGIEAASIWAQAFDQVARSVAQAFANMVFGLQGSAINFQQLGANILAQALTPVFQSFNPFAPTTSGLSGFGSIFQPNAFSISGFDPLVSSINSLFGIGGPTSQIGFGVNAAANAISGSNLPTSAGLFGLGSIGTAAGLGVFSTAFGLLSGQGVGRSLLSGGLTGVGAAFGGPLGAAAGGLLGGVLGGLFGNKEPPDVRGFGGVDFSPLRALPIGGKGQTEQQVQAIRSLSQEVLSFAQVLDQLGGRFNAPSVQFDLSGKYSDLVRIGNRVIETGTQNDIAAVQATIFRELVPTITGLDDTLQEILRESKATNFNALAQELSAVQAATSAAETAVLQQTLAAGAQIRGFLDAQSLSDLSSLSPTQQLAEAQSQFGANLALVRGGDIGAVGALTASAETLLRFGRAQYASTVSFAALEQSVRSSLAQVGVDLTSPASIDERMAAAIDAQTATQQDQHDEFMQAINEMNAELRSIKREIQAQNAEAA